MKLHQFSLITFLLALMALSSCSKRSELLDTIPADSNVVALADVRKICSELGITFSPTGASIPGELKSKLGLNDDSNGLLDLLGRLDASGTADVSAVAMVYYDDRMVMTLPVESLDRLKALDCPWLQWGDDSEGFATGTLGKDLSVVASDSQLWLLDVSPKAASTVKSLLKAADKQAVGGIDAIARSLTAGKLVNMAVLMENEGEKDGEKENHDALLASTWSLIGINVDGKRLVADVSMVKGTGEDIAVEGMQPVNPAVLSYVPSSCSMAFAAGLTPRFNWDFLKLLATVGGDFQTRAAIDVAVPFLSSIDGTVLAAAAPANEEAFSDPDPSNWNFIIMAHLSQEKIDQLLGMVRTMMFTSGVSPRVDKDGIMVVPQYGMNLYMGNVDGYFAVATFPFDNNRDNSLAPVFGGKEAAAVFSLPSVSLLSPSAPSWGLDVKAQFDGSKGQVELSLPGSEGSVLVNLLSLL